MQGSASTAALLFTGRICCSFGPWNWTIAIASPEAADWPTDEIGRRSPRTLNLAQKGLSVSGSPCSLAIFRTWRSCRVVPDVPEEEGARLHGTVDAR